MDLSIWTEAYRPKTLKDVINQEHVVERLKSFVKDRNIPHMIFAGGPGTGKTTVSLCIAHELYGKNWRQNVLNLNASDERGINVIRNQVKNFARTKPIEDVPFKIIILDEADNMCLHPDTEVIVGKLDKLKKVRLKDLPKIKSFNLPSFNTKYWTIENDIGKLVNSGKAPLYEIEFEDHKKILASPRHPFFMIKNNCAIEIPVKNLKTNTKILCFDDRFLKCNNCGKLFFRRYPYPGYVSHFCSMKCRNKFFGSLSKNRDKTRRREIGKKGAKTLWTTLYKDEKKFKIYRQKRRKIDIRLFKEGRLKFKHLKKGEGPWLGEKLSKKHKEKIRKGTRRFYQTPRGIKVKSILSKLTREMNLHNPKMRTWYKSEKFKKHVRRLGIEAQQIKKDYKGLEDKLAFLLSDMNIKYRRQVPIRSKVNGQEVVTIADFLVENLAIYVNGCFWHCCPVCGIKPKYEFQKDNLMRDELSISLLRGSGRKVLVLWEHQFGDEDEIRRLVFEALGISGHGRMIPRKNRVKSIRYKGEFNVLNISVEKNNNFFLANGILTHNTSDAQQALRRTMENFTKTARFCLICNYSSRIISPIQSRCAVFRFKSLSKENVFEYMKRIINGEKLKINKEALEAIHLISGGDLRKAANILQASATLGKKIDKDRIYEVAAQAEPKEVIDMINYALNGKFLDAREILKELLLKRGISGQDIIKEISNQLYKLDISDKTKIELVERVGEIEHRMGLGANEQIQLETLLAQILLVGNRTEN